MNEKELIFCDDNLNHSVEAQDFFMFMINQSRQFVFNLTEKDDIVFDKEKTGYDCAICWYIKEVDPKAMRKKEKDEELSQKLKLENEKKIQNFLNRKRK